MNLQLANYSPKKTWGTSVPHAAPPTVSAAPQNPGPRTTLFEEELFRNNCCVLDLIIVHYMKLYIRIYVYVLRVLQLILPRADLVSAQGKCCEQHGCRHLSLALRPFYSLLPHITLVTYSLKQTLISIRPSFEANQKFMKTIDQRSVCLWLKNDHFLLSFCRTTLVLFSAGEPRNRKPMCQPLGQITVTPGRFQNCWWFRNAKQPVDR